MKAKTFEQLAKEITGLNIKIYLPDDKTKWANYYPFNGELQPKTKYGISFDGSIQYDFKTTTKKETFFKSFINQHISKYELKQYLSAELVNGQIEFIYPTKEQVYKRYTSDRVTKYHYYTTLYGIGMFAFFTKDITIATAKLAKYLKNKGVEYYNEYSDAGWAYRFVINDKVENHNELLENFNI